tara:strand:- start:590 stop:886 length:297 start_codon:yes stop_codon:yes gene_type:complete
MILKQKITTAVDINKAKEKIQLDKTHQEIITQLDNKIKKLEKELGEIKNIEKQHQYINGLLHEEVNKLKKENEKLKKDNAIFKENLQAELIRYRKNPT